MAINGVTMARPGSVKEVNVDLPVVGSTDYKAASTVKLDIKNGGNLVCGVVRMAEDSLHAAEV